MLEKGQNGMVWRPLFAPMPIKNVVVEPTAVWLTGSSGWIQDDVQFFDEISLTVDVVMRNVANRDLENLRGLIDVHVGQVLLGTFQHNGAMTKGSSMKHSVTGVIKAKDGQAEKALLDCINAQNPQINPVVAVMVTGDLWMPMRGPVGKFVVANQAVSIKNLSINRRSGSRVRILEEV
jgi:hypothetical protein